MWRSCWYFLLKHVHSKFDDGKLYICGLNVQNWSSYTLFPKKRAKKLYYEWSHYSYSCNKCDYQLAFLNSWTIILNLSRIWRDLKYWFDKSELNSINLLVICTNYSKFHHINSLTFSRSISYSVKCVIQMTKYRRRLIFFFFCWITIYRCIKSKHTSKNEIGKNCRVWNQKREIKEERTDSLRGRIGRGTQTIQCCYLITLLNSCVYLCLCVCEFGFTKNFSYLKAIGATLIDLLGMI